MRAHHLLVVALCACSSAPPPAPAPPPRAHPAPADAVAPGEALAEGLTRIGTPIVVALPPPAPAAPEGTTVTLAVGFEAGRLFVVPDGDASRRTTLAVDADADAFAAALRPLVTGADRVVLAADASLPYQTVVSVLDAVRTAGVTRFAVSVRPEGN